MSGPTTVLQPASYGIDGSRVSPSGTSSTVSDAPTLHRPSGVPGFGSSSLLLPSRFTFTLGTRTFTVNPTGFAFGNLHISPGGSPQTLDGATIGLDQSGVLAIGSTTISLVPPTNAVGNKNIFTVAGQTVTAETFGFSMAGTAISVGGPAVTVNGRVVSLQTSGTLIIGSSTFPIPTSQARSTVSDVNGLTFQAESSLAVVDGSTLTPGAAEITVAGTAVSLESGAATLDIGTNRVPLSAVSTNATASIQDFEGGQGKNLEVPFLLVLGFCILLSLTA